MYSACRFLNRTVGHRREELEENICIHISVLFILTCPTRKIDVCVTPRYRVYSTYHEVRSYTLWDGEVQRPPVLKGGSMAASQRAYISQALA